MGFEAMKWSLAALSIVGVVLNIRRRRECFVVWCATNAAWTVVDVIHGVWAQAALQFVYQPGTFTPVPNFFTDKILRTAGWHVKTPADQQIA